MLNKWFRKNNKKINKILPKTPRYNIAQIYSIRAEQNMEVSSSQVAKTVEKSMNYRPLEIRAKRLGKLTEESKCDMYKQSVPQYNIIKKLVNTNDKNIKIDNINYKKLESKIKDLEEKRDYKIDLLELDLYNSYIDEFYILKSYMDKE